MPFSKLSDPSSFPRTPLSVSFDDANTSCEFTEAFLSSELLIVAAAQSERLKIINKVAIGVQVCPTKQTFLQML